MSRHNVPSTDEEGKGFKWHFAPKPLILFIPDATAAQYFALLQWLEANHRVVADESIVAMQENGYQKGSPSPCRIIHVSPIAGTHYATFEKVTRAFDTGRIKKAQRASTKARPVSISVDFNTAISDLLAKRSEGPSEPVEPSPLPPCP